MLCSMNNEAARLNAITEQIIGAAIEVHRVLGPGLLESAYEACLYFDRMDLVVENAVIVEVKSVVKLDRVHEAQMLSYLKIADLRVGLVLNFNVKNLSSQGIMRKVNNFPE
jgi:hypothetical protein